MPVYEYWCPACAERFEAVHSVAEYLAPTFHHCGVRGEKRIFSATVVCDDLPGYQSPIDGRWIEGRKARREDMLRHGCHPYDPADKAFYAKRRQDEERAFDKAIDETVEREFAAMPTRKKELLAQEVQAGASAELVRMTP